MNRILLLTLVAVVCVGLGTTYILLNSGQSSRTNFEAAAAETPPTAAPTAAQGQQASPAETTPEAAEPQASQEFRFSFSEFPEFQPVLKPADRDEYLTVHWSDTVIGDPQAPVTVMEFFSYICSHCRNFHDGAYQQLLLDYVDTGLVKVVKREFILNRNSVGVELLAGAGTQCFTDVAQRQVFDSAMFAQQDTLARASNAQTAMIPLFLAAGLEETQARSCMADPRNRSLVLGRALRAIALEEVNSTPTLFINKVKYTDYYNNYGTLRAAIETALSATN